MIAVFTKDNCVKLPEAFGNVSKRFTYQSLDYVMVTSVLGLVKPFCVILFAHKMTFLAQKHASNDLIDRFVFSLTTIHKTIHKTI